jgi:hypothetical protein
MIEVSKQFEYGRFGARWACYSTALGNIIECEREHKFDEFDVCAAIGALFKHESVWMANYKDHDRIMADLPELVGWGPDRDPEIHFWVSRQNEAVRELMRIFRIGRLRMNHRIMVFNTDEGKHFMLENESGRFNPDPSVEVGKLLEVRKVVV